LGAIGANPVSWDSRDVGDELCPMQREQIVFVGTSDLSGHFRGKSFPAADLAARMERGVGLAPTNIFLSAFGPIQMTTFGTQGEVFLMPDASTRVFLPFDGGAAEYFFLADIKTLEGAPWDFCPRQVLRRALERMQSETGFSLLATFEQEFTYSGAGPLQQPYELDAYRRQGVFGEALLAALRQVGVIPDSFLAEFGARQYEVTSAPVVGLRAAVTAPSVASYYRLRPNRWAPTQADVGRLDRGTALRICPVVGGELAQRAAQFNVEFRVADATASPYLALAMLVQAGLDGIRHQWEIESMDARALPKDLGQALDLLEASESAGDWLGRDLMSAYLQFKRAEIKGLEDLNETEICRRYAEVY
jgi:glutamine synthetase